MNAVSDDSLPGYNRGHRLARMKGRDPDENHRAAAPLELLFDLTFVVAFGQAADQLAHVVAAGHPGQGILGFVFAIGATCWAWINFSWFASAYDTDDWLYRVTTMVQMIGVIIFALGLPAMFESLESAGRIDDSVIVAGYVIMRVAMIAQWLRAARQDQPRRSTALAYALLVGMAQVAWVALAILHQSAPIFFACAGLLFVFEVACPVLAERKTSGTPWNPQHIAERNGLLAIIALGEAIFGTVAAVSVLVEEQGWSTEAVLVVVAGIGITFGLWWTYFTVPAGEILARHRERSFLWGYGQVLILGAIAAIGAGLHVVAYVVEGHAAVGVTGAIVAVTVPALVFSVTLFGLNTYLLREVDPFRAGLVAGSVAILILAIGVAAAGVSIGLCLILVTLAPAVVVVGDETIGYRRGAAAAERERS
jgi:low temperature requirement protein LtrA